MLSQGLLALTFKDFKVHSAVKGSLAVKGLTPFSAECCNPALPTPVHLVLKD